MIILSGYSGSGKDTVLKELIKLGYKPIVSYTTRPIRSNEQNGVEYHFISEEEFTQRKKDGFFAETTHYDMVGGRVYYGSSVEDFNNNPDGIAILNPDGLRQIREKGLSYTSFYLDVPFKTLAARLILRGDDIEEFARRLEADKIDFSNIHKEVDFVIDAAKKKPFQIALEILDRVNNDSENKSSNFLCLDKPNYENVVYIAHKFQNDPKNMKRVEDIILKLRELYPTYLFISPIHAFSFEYTSTDYQLGLNMCLFLLNKCDCMWVFDEHSDSVGVQGEKAFCRKHKIPYKVWSEDEVEEKLGL